MSFGIEAQNLYGITDMEVLCLMTGGLRSFLVILPVFKGFGLLAKIPSAFLHSSRIR